MDAYEHEELSDEALEKEIEAALGVDPSPEFLPRIRARIASEHVDEGWLSSGLWRWAGAAVAVAVVAILGLWVSSGPAPAPRDAQIANAPRIEPPAPAIVASSPESAAPVVAPVVREVRQRRRPIQARSEVVISQEEAAALRTLFTAISNRRLEPSQLPDLAAALKPPDPIEDIVVEPITIVPLAPLEGE
jgi:hypothetical protein